jgi:stress-induced morphogen
MTAKITNFFKIVPIQVETEDSNVPKFSECQVVLKGNKHQYSKNKLRSFNKFSLPGRNNICKFCEKEYSSKSNMLAHVRKIHQYSGQNQQFECDFDGKVFRSKGELFGHMRTHLPLVECTICHKMLKRLCLKPHLRGFHVTDKKFQCKICSKHFKSKQSLRKHEKTHNKKFECDACKKSYPSKSELNRHNKNYHENPRSFECETCGKKFNTKSCLKSHQLIHKKDRLKSFKCQRCDYATDFKYNIKNHQKCHERQDQKFAAMKNPVKCEICPNFQGKNIKALRQHMNFVHSQKEPFQCDLCAKFLKTKQHLTTHIKLHIRKINCF